MASTALPSPARSSGITARPAARLAGDGRAGHVDAAEPDATGRDGRSMPRPAPRRARAARCPRRRRFRRSRRVAPKRDVGRRAAARAGAITRRPRPRERCRRAARWPGWRRSRPRGRSLRERVSVDVVSAVTNRPETRPSRSTVTSVDTSSTSWILCVTRTTVRAGASRPPDHGEQRGHLRGGEHGGRLVENEDAGVAVQRLRESRRAGVHPPRDAPTLACGIGVETVALGQVDEPVRRAAADRCGPPRGSAPKTTFSATVIESNSESAGAPCRGRRRWRRAAERKRASPSTTRSRPNPGAPARTESTSSVDLPAPFSPITAWISPRATERST